MIPLRSWSQTESAMIIPYALHHARRSHLMNLIRDTQSVGHRDQGQSVAGSDYWISADIHRPYLKEVDGYIMPYVSQALENRYLIQRYHAWFQCYGPGDHHGWHCHQGLHNWSMIYYLELAHRQQVTDIWINNGIHQPPVTEGDILIMPSTWYHRSRPNDLGPKTVIAVNIDMTPRELL